MAERFLDNLKIYNKEIDLRSSDGAIAVLERADNIIQETGGNIDFLREIESSMFLRPNRFSMLQHMAVKAALSKSIVNAIDRRTHISIVVPMYHEERRIAPRSGSKMSLGRFEFAQDIHGENALLRRNIELAWLTNNNKLVSYDLLFVDDMCDRNSGLFAQELIDKNGLENCRVAFLGDALKDPNRSELVTSAIETIINNDGNSIRGGALCLGFAQSIDSFEQSGASTTNHVVGYMDADSSYSGSHVGIALDLVNQPNVFAATASRQHALTFMEKPNQESQTSHRSPGLIRLKQTVGYLRRHIVGDLVPADTQSGFKLFREDVLRKTLLEPNKAHNFSYDTQLLARIARMDPNSSVIRTFGVTLLDSDELSTANNGMTYYAALEILNDISSESGYQIDHEESALLTHLTSSVENYKHAIHMLEDGTESSTPYNSLASVRERIKTDKDTTAVGNYFDHQLCSDIVKVLIHNSPDTQD